jgi:hypothetical protein
MRLTCDFTVSGEISRVRAMCLLANHCEDSAFPCGQRIADASAGLLRRTACIAGVPSRKQAADKR